MHAAIYLKNNVVCKTNNIEKKQKKENTEFEILEQWEFDNDMTRIDERYKFWCNQRKTTINNETPKDEIKFYHFKNTVNNHTITSIYPNLDNIPNINKDEWIEI